MKTRFTVDFIVEQDENDPSNTYCFEGIRNAIESQGHKSEIIGGTKYQNYCLYVSINSPFTKKEIEEIDAFIDSNRGLFEDLRELEEREKRIDEK